MARGQDNGTTILLGLKDCKVGEVVGGEERVVVKTSAKGKEKKCPHCGSARLYGHGSCKPREVLHTWSNGRRVYLDLHRRRLKCRDCKHSFRHQELVHTVTEVKQRRVLGILRDDRIATLKKFLSKIPGDKVREVCIDMKDGLRKAVEAVFPSARVVVDPFHVIADSNKRMDEARRIEQDVHRKKKVQIPKKIFLVGREKLTEERRQKVDTLLDKYPGLKGFYWAKEKIRELYRQQSREEATRLLDNVIFNLKSADDAELVRWGNT